MAEADRQHDGVDTRQIPGALNSPAGENSGNRKRLMKNFFLLSLFQRARSILPLITVPYLVRMLNPKKFGMVAFAQVFIESFGILTDYSFNPSTAREISSHPDECKKTSEIIARDGEFILTVIIPASLLVLAVPVMLLFVSQMNLFLSMILLWEFLVLSVRVYYLNRFRIELAYADNNS